MRLLLSCLLLLALAPCLTAFAQGETFTCKFAPPVGAEYDELLTKTVVTTYQGEKQTVVSIGEERVRIEREANGYRYRYTIGDISQTRNGAPMPANTWTKGLIITDFINLKGELTGIAGVQAFRERIKKYTPPDSVNAMLAKASDKYFLTYEKIDWERRVARFLGREVRVGDTWIDTVAILLPNDERLPVYRATTITEKVMRNNKALLRITVKCRSKADGLATAIGRTTAEVIGAVPEPLPVEEDVEFASNSEILLDPATMLYHGEIIATRTILYMVTPDRRKIPIDTMEQKKFRITYR